MKIIFLLYIDSLSSVQPRVHNIEWRQLKWKWWVLIITSTEVVLLERRDAWIIMKQRRLSAKAKFKTASGYKICKKRCHSRLQLLRSVRNLTKSQKSKSKIAWWVWVIFGIFEEFHKIRQQNYGIHSRLQKCIQLNLEQYTNKLDGH